MIVGLPTDPARRGAMLAATLALVGLYFVHSWIHVPRRERAEGVQARIQEIESHLRAGPGLPSTVVGSQPSQIDRNPLLGRHLTHLESLIPAASELPALLESISTEAARVGVTVTLLRPEPPLPGEPYATWSYRIAARGGYHEIAAFITAIASLDRILVPGDLHIHPSPGDEPVPAEAVLAEFIIRTHVRPNPP